jgi:hypothetical protein
MLLIKRIAIAVSSVVLFFGIGILVAQVQIMIQKKAKTGLTTEATKPKVAGAEKKATNKEAPHEEINPGKEKSVAENNKKIKDVDPNLDEPEENPNDIIEDPEAENL